MMIEALVTRVACGARLKAVNVMMGQQAGENEQ